MNVVKRNKHLDNAKFKSKFRNELVRKDSSLGIRGTSLLPIVSYNTASVSRPRYQFNKEDDSTKKSSMGPPSGLPKATKKKILQSSNSTRQESSSSGLPRPRVLVSETAPDTSVDFRTPRNRPTALRYISSSSRGGYSGTRSGRSTSSSAVEASVILAISEGRGMARGEIGIAAIDLRHPHLVLCQFSDTLLYTHTLTKINYFNPIEIIVPHTFCEGVHPNQLYQLIRDRFPLINLTTVQRKHFNDDAGRQQIQTLCAPQYSGVYLQVLQKFYAVTAAAAVLKYVEYIQCVVFSRESLKIEYHSSENTMVIDVGTATQLELVQPLIQSAGPSCCLLGILGPTYTVGGIRALRAAILQPSCNKTFIEGRLEAVQDLIDNDSGLMTGIQDVIKNLSEVDKILLLCMESQNQNMEKIGEAQLNQTLLLKTTMEMVPKLVEALTVASSGILRKIKMDLENPHYKDIADRIKTVIQDDAHLEKGVMGSLQRCFAVKPEINGLLDVARRTYSELIEDIQKIVEQLSESYDLPLRLNQNVMKGFHIILPIAPKNRRTFNVEDLPATFIQVRYSGASVSMTTEELVVLDQQAKESLSEIQKMSNIVIASLLKELRPFMSSLYKLCENVAELDILLALAHSSSVGSYIRPQFSDYLDIRNSVHPLLDYNSQVMPVPNDIYASPEQNFTIITGPNMGGKSIYIKQVAVLQIMAQLGCFLPATNAVLRLCDRIFSRIGFNDSVELNASTYVIEMKEMQHIMAGMTKSSLVIIDELCRGTNSEEGTSMAWAICEELLMSEAFTFFTTHFIYLTRLQDMYFNVVNRHTAVAEEDVSQTQNSQKRLVYQHKIEIGITKVERYGLALAEKTNLPTDTVKLARELSDLIIKDKKPQQILTPEINDERMLYKLNAEIRLESRKHGDSDETIKALVQKFKRDHPQVIQRLKLQRMRQNTSIVKDTTNTSSDYNTNQIGYYAVVGNKSVSSNELHSVNKRLHVICGSSDPDSETPLQNSAKDHKYSNILNKSMTNTPGKTNKPKIIYTTSSTDSNIVNNYLTSVRSSNQLLTTFGNVSDREDSDNFEADVERQSVTSNPQNDEISDENCLIGVPNKSNNSDFHNNISEIKDSFRESNKSLSQESMIIRTNEHFDSDDSDIAEALTQVIEEYSSSKGSVDSNERSDDYMSVDQELMEETVKEIQAELSNNCANDQDILDFAILTPPLGFRD